MSAAAPAAGRRKRTKAMWWIGAATIVLLGVFCYRLIGPNPPIVISRTTTYITEPLRTDGLPDYPKYVFDKLREDVTEQNNAAVVMWQVFGLNCSYDTISVNDWRLLDEELSLGPLPPSDRLLTLVHSQENRAAILKWLAEHAPDWLRAPIEDPAALAELNLTQADLDADSVIDLAMNSPWRRDDLPPLADWVSRNERPLDSLVEASRRPLLYAPSVELLRHKGKSLRKMTFDQISRSREIARALKVRAMLCVGEGRPEEVWEDLLAAHRWARLVAQGPFVIDQLVAMAIDGIACDGDIALLACDNLPVAVARQIQQDLLSLTSPSNVAECLDQGERLYCLDSIVSYSRRGIGAFYADNFRWSLETGTIDMSVWKIKFLDSISSDWNFCLIESNRLFDRIVAAARLSNFKDRQREFDHLGVVIYDRELMMRTPWCWAVAAVNPRSRNELLGAAVAAAFSSSFSAASEAQDRGNEMLSLTRLAAALAVYRAEHGEYPDRLEQLVPNVIPELPVDLYHARPFVYQRDGEGYLLYSTGPNGIDDGGSNEQYGGGIFQGRKLPWNDKEATEKLRQQIPGGADDIAIRVPVPTFKLPAPAPAR